METPAPSRPAAPAVVAVVVTRDPGPWLEQAVDALAAQDYSNLAVLFIDAASDTDPTPRIARALPNAYVRRLDEDRGFGASANQVREIVDGAAFFCFLHDDAAPEPEAIRTLVDEAVRSNAGIVGGKLVQLDDRRRLLQVGESVDKTGERSTVVDPGELDQEQYDAVRDVFVVPGGCTLVRADLFEAIGGFDEGIDLLNDDLSLCWRAHVAGARVVVAPDAVIGHAEALGERSDTSLRRQRLIRHRLRTMLVCYSRWHRVRVLPQAAFVAVLEIVYSVLTGRRRQAQDVIAAWRWNWRRRGEIRALHQKVEGFRGVPDAEIRRFQVRGFSRLNAFLRGTSSRGASPSDRAEGAWRRFVAGLRSGELRWPVIAWAITILIVAFGSRHLIQRPIATVGGFLPFDEGPGELFDSFLSGWRTTGLGSSSPAPTAFGLLAGAGALLFGAMGALRQVLLLGSIAVGLIGAYRLLRPAASPRAQAVALVVYGAIPVAYDAVADARWGSLAVYAATPWLLGQLGRAAGWAPFGAVDGDAGPGVRRPDLVGRVASIGLLLALVAAIDPAVLPVFAVVIAALALGSAIAGAPHGVLRLLVGGLGGVAVAVVLHVPWMLDFVLPGARWEQVVGHAGVAETPTLGSLFRFDVGPVGGSLLALGFPIAATLPLLIGRGWRFDWAVRAWTVALTLIGLTWAGGDDRLPLALPPAETMLAPAAASMAIAAGLGVVAFEVDLRQYHFGWRQVASIVAGVALVIGAVPTMLDAGNGRWYLPGGDLESTFGFLEEEEPGFRVLWIGHPDVLPLPGHGLDLPDGDEPTSDHVVYATSQDGLPGITDGWPGSEDGPTRLIEDALVLAARGETSRLGRLLAPMAIRYVVVPSASAPRPLGGVQRPAPAQVTGTLADQLDLAAVPVNPAYTVYRNEAALPSPAMIPATAGSGTAFEVTAGDLVGAEPVLSARVAPTTWTGDVPAGARIHHASAASDRWELLVEGRPAPKTKLFGWAQGFEPATSGDATLRYDTAPVRYGVLAFQALFWLVAIHFARRTRRRDPVATTSPTRVTPATPAAPAESVVEPADWLAPAEEWPADPTPALLDELEPEPAPESEPEPDPEPAPDPDEEDRP
ncbi:glycosyltransferase [Salinilacustrithrix flava]|uniref:glycosyltransferase family 2 protein n=1 Tax=Salinilacustrithrix flava TaxID=2957203 RepID=UPI003D7C2BC5